MIDGAVVFTARECAQLVTGSGADADLAADAVSIRTLASLVSPGTELAMQYTGEKFPAHPGYAAVGRVVRVGTAVHDLKPEDVVLNMGPHQSHSVRPRRELVPVPVGLDPAKATFARLMAVSMATLSTTRARPPAGVLVTGLGPIGHLGAQVFRAAGYRVIGVDPDARRRRWAADKGVTDVVDRVPDDRNVSLVLECSGHEQAVLDACRSVLRGGEVVLAGVPWKQRTDLSAHGVLREVFHRYVTLRSGWEWELPFEPPNFSGPSTLENFRGALDWLASGRVDVNGMYELVSPSDAQQTYQALLTQTGPRLAAVFDWRPGA